MKNNKAVKHFGLCGHPIAHSLSPRLFEAAYPKDGFSYEIIPASTPAEALRLFVEGGFMGMNVTAPFKTSILPLVHRQTQECAAIGACNLILKEGDLLVAHNTDYLGVAHSIDEANAQVQGALCLLLGAGGAAKAAAYALLKAGALLLWANRTSAHIPNFFLDRPITPLPLAQIGHHLPQSNLILNTLPLSLPNTQILRFHPSQTVFDASYAARPLEQPATKAGAKYIGGERWLLHQAVPSFEAMTGICPNLADMEQVIQNLFLS
ncbi:MAG: hypothetical protein FWE30_00030 [Bacteroidales bacterium]|nr:hypothetical protein [Bacteroidales bacterium]MCL2737820.1 hypothetical protein [Bacteroidales bacterium]